MCKQRDPDRMRSTYGVKVGPSRDVWFAAESDPDTELRCSVEVNHGLFSVHGEILAINVRTKRCVYGQIEVTYGAGDPADPDGFDSLITLRPNISEIASIMFLFDDWEALEGSRAVGWSREFPWVTVGLQDPAEAEREYVRFVDHENGNIVFAEAAWVEEASRGCHGW